MRFARFREIPLGDLAQRRRRPQLVEVARIHLEVTDKQRALQE